MKYERLVIQYFCMTINVSESTFVWNLPPYQERGIAHKKDGKWSASFITQQQYGEEIFFKLHLKVQNALYKEYLPNVLERGNFLPNLCFMSLKKVNLRPILHESLCTKVYLNNKNTDIGCWDLHTILWGLKYYSAKYHIAKDGVLPSNLSLFWIL